MSYVPIQQPTPIQSISFKRLSDNTVQITCNGFVTDVANVTETIGKKVTETDDRIVIRNRRKQLEYIFPLSSLDDINDVPWTGTNVQNAIDAIIAGVFAGDGDTIGKFNQVITVTPPASVSHLHAPFTLVGVNSSGLPIVWTSSDPTKFTISGNTLTPVAAGTANIVANAVSDSNYNAAPTVTTPYTLT